MNPLIKKQLEGCRVANIPDFEETDTVINIPKGSALNVTHYQVGKCYYVEIADYVINPPEGYTLASNWNKGTSPKYKYSSISSYENPALISSSMSSGVYP